MGNAGSLQLSGYGVDNVKIGRQVAIKYNDEQGNCTQSVKFNGNTNNTQEINFNGDTKTHQAFMSIVGNDNIFDINDLENVKEKVMQYGAKVDDSNLKETGAVKISFANGKSLSIDFWTDKEIEEFKENTTSDIEKLGKTLGTALQKVWDRVWDRGIAKQIDRFTERL